MWRARPLTRAPQAVQAGMDEIDRQAASEGSAMRSAPVARRLVKRKPGCRPINGPPVPLALRTPG